MATLPEIKRHNKKIGHFFFDKGNSPVLAKKGDYLVTRGMGGSFVVYKYDKRTGKIDLVDNPIGAYSWQPYTSKRDAIIYAEELAKKRR